MVVGVAGRTIIKRYMIIQNDIFGEIPCVGDTIVFNPPQFKGLVYGRCMGFSKAGLPLVKVVGDCAGSKTKEGYSTPKTGFVIRNTIKTLA